MKATALRQVLERQGYRCALSGLELTPQNCSADHVLPLKRGGSHAIENIQLVREEVNAAKGTMTNGEFITMCRQVSEHNPSFIEA